MPKEIFAYNKPVFRQQLLTEGLTREVYIAPETCPTKNLSFWIVRPSELKEQPKDQPRGTYDVHEGMEEGVYIVKGRVKLLTPNESVTLEQGGCAWIPAGMPHRAEVLSDEIVAVAPSVLHATEKPNHG